MRSKIPKAAARVWWLPLVLLASVGAVALEYQEQYAPLAVASNAPESFVGDVLIDVIQIPNSKQRIATVLVDFALEGSLPDGMADRLFQFQTLDAGDLSPGFYRNAVVRYGAGTLELTSTDHPVPVRFTVDQLMLGIAGVPFVGGFGLSRTTVSGDVWKLNPRGLTPQQRVKLLDDCPDRPAQVPAGCASYGPTECGVSDCDGSPGGCNLDCSGQGNCCAWCGPDGACCRCILIA
jgi:hypothetical protein